MIRGVLKFYVALTHYMYIHPNFQLCSRGIRRGNRVKRVKNLSTWPFDLSGIQIFINSVVENCVRPMSGDAWRMDWRRGGGGGGRETFASGFLLCGP